MKLEEDMLKTEIYKNMIERDEKKYKWFIRALKSLKHIKPAEGRFLESYYIIMRYVDDVVDEDIELPKGYTTTAEFVQSKINFIEIKKPRDKLEYLMKDCFEQAKTFGEDFEAETRDILNSMLFDAKRKGKMQIFSENELKQHFYELDIRGTVKGALKIFGEKEDYEKIKPLGIASRIYYNLRDYREDIEKGYVNISEEECNRFGITKNKLEDITCKEIQNWMREQAKTGKELIKNYNGIKKDLKILTRITLKIVYEMPATKFFEKIMLNL